MATTDETPVKKSSQNESGHAINVANFSQLVTEIKSFSADYNPSSDILKVANLETLRDSAKTALNSMHQADSVYRDAINKRQLEFDKMSSLVTRISGAVKAAGVDSKVKEEISSLNKKIKGGGIKSETTENSHSTSQMSYDNRLNNFTQLVVKLKGIPEYKPNEASLAPDSLDAYINSLAQVTESADKAWSELDRARSERDRLLYSDINNLVPVALRVKEYTKSLYGTKSREYKAVSALKFKNN
ncbi:MAG: hypothetical protein V1874_03665 [Spirochaetota bacterium]